MDALLVATGAVVGVAAGAVLDPVGQRLADRSRAADERRRAERAERRAAEESGSGDEVPGSGDGVEGGPGPVDAEGTPETAPDEDAAATVARHVLPAGRSVPRQIGAALVAGALCAAATDRITAAGTPGCRLLTVPFWVFLIMAVTVSVTDLSHRLVPRQLVYGAIILEVPLLIAVSAVAHSWRPLTDAAIAGVGAFLVFFLIWFFVPRGMGFGDVRLAGVIGLTAGYLDLIHAYIAFLFGFVLGLVLGIVLMVGSGQGRRTRIPFAPALCVGAVVTILWGDPIAHHLLHVGS